MNTKLPNVTRRQMLGTAAVAAISANEAQAQTATPTTDTRPVSRDALKAWTTLFAAQLTEGVPLVKIMKICTEQAQGDYLRRVSEGVNGVVNLGYPLSQAMALHPDVFSANYIAHVRYGEMHGIVDETMNALLKNWDALIK